MLSALVPDELQLGHEDPPADLSQVGFYVPEYMGPRNSLELITQMPNLEVVQLLTVGFDTALEYVPDHVSLCNAVGVHDDGIALEGDAEHAGVPSGWVLVRGYDPGRTTQVGHMAATRRVVPPSATPRRA